MTKQIILQDKNVVSLIQSPQKKITKTKSPKKKNNIDDNVNQNVKSNLIVDRLQELEQRNIKYIGNEKNLNVDVITTGSHVKLHLQCMQCGHNFKMATKLLFGVKMSGCQHCGGGIKSLCPKDDNCSQCVDKSIASHLETLETARFIKYVGNIEPCEIPFKSHKMLEWKCCQCNNNFFQMPHNIFRDKKFGCNKCCNNKPLKMCENNDNSRCLKCFKKSLAFYLNEHENDLKMKNLVYQGNDKNIPLSSASIGSNEKIHNILCTTCQNVFKIDSKHFCRGAKCPNIRCNKQTC